MEKLKAVDAEAYAHEGMAEEEPKYLRRQKPVQIKQRKFGKRAWRLYFRILVIAVVTTASAATLYAVGDFLLTSRRMALVRPQQVEISGTQYVSRASVLEVFSADRGKSLLRVPLDERRRQLEAMPWVERATVRRALPNRIQVEVVERVPVAFLRQGTELALLDENGVILEKPIEGDFNFPVVAGISATMPIEARTRRMKMFGDFLQQIDLAKPGASAKVSEVDLSDATDVHATITGMSGGETEAPIAVHFGDRDFQAKFRLLLDNIAQWRETAGRVESVDLRFSREVVVNPESTTPSAKKIKVRESGKGRH